MKTWKDLLIKIIRNIWARESKSCWGMNGAIDAMMESRQQVKQKVVRQEQWKAQHLRRRALFEQLKNGKNLNEEEHRKI